MSEPINLDPIEPTPIGPGAAAIPLSPTVWDDAEDGQHAVTPNGIVFQRRKGLWHMDPWWQNNGDGAEIAAICADPDEWAFDSGWPRHMVEQAHGVLTPIRLPGVTLRERLEALIAPHRVIDTISGRESEVGKFHVRVRDIRALLDATAPTATDAPARRGARAGGGQVSERPAEYDTSWPCCKHCGPVTERALPGAQYGNGGGHNEPCRWCVTPPEGGVS